MARKATTGSSHIVQCMLPWRLCDVTIQQESHFSCFFVKKYQHTQDEISIQLDILCIFAQFLCKSMWFKVNLCIFLCITTSFWKKRRTLKIDVFCNYQIPPDACSRRCCFMRGWNENAPPEIHVKSNVVWCKHKGEIREIAKSEISKSQVSCPDSGFKLRNQIAKSRNREKSGALPRFRIQDPETESRNREIAKSRNRIGPESRQGQYCLRTAEWCPSTAGTPLLKYCWSTTQAVPEHCRSTA